MMLNQSSSISYPCLPLWFWSASFPRIINKCAQSGQYGNGYAGECSNWLQWLSKSLVIMWEGNVFYEFSFSTSLKRRLQCA